VGQNLVGSVTAASRFEDTRKDLSDKMTQAVSSVLSSYNSEEEKLSVFQSLKNTMYISSAANVLALSSGLATGLEAVDLIPGAAATMAFVVIGISVIPYSNGKAIKEYEKIWNHRDAKLGSALESLCSKEIQRIHKRILDGVSPYTRYVQTEEEAITTLNEECDNLSNSSQILRNRINRG